MIYGGGRLQLFFLALLLHSGVVGKVEDEVTEDRKSTRLNSSHIQKSRMPSSA